MLQQRAVGSGTSVLQVLASTTISINEMLNLSSDQKPTSLKYTTDNFTSISLISNTVLLARPKRESNRNMEGQCCLLSILCYSACPVPACDPPASVMCGGGVGKSQRFCKIVDTEELLLPVWILKVDVTFNY